MLTRVDPLAELIRSGEEEEVARRLLPIARKMARAVLGLADPDLVATAANDAVLAACRNGRRFEGRSRATTWLYAITRRAALRCMSKENGWKSWEEIGGNGNPAASHALASATSPIARTLAQEHLCTAVPNEEWRRIWLLRNDPKKRLSQEEVARLTGYTPGSVAAILSKVRKRIEKAGEADLEV
ncbi:MAG: sigma-70 family RNA polymerase sigma factor [Candidatus Eisenbacteria bacterium]|nr:sigma-70 family RNA polymerase sigma factor [Candidatus Eisenbacteria bacterium]